MPRVKNTDPVPYYSLEKMHRDIQEGMQETFLSVLEGNWFVMGRYLEEFEAAFAEYIHTEYAVGVGSGLDGLKISLRCLDIKTGDKVIIPAMTFSATVLAAVEIGITPVLTDVDPVDCLITADLLSNSLQTGVKAIIPVHLYGNPCDMEGINRIAENAGIFVIEDFAQSVGATVGGRPAGSFGTVNTTSFYPVKPLGALGDGGMITTSDPELKEQCLKLRNYGYAGKYRMELLGYNSRLDEMQAAFLLLKLQHLEKWRRERENIAFRYMQNLSDLDEIILPVREESRSSAFHVFPIRLPERDKLSHFLKENRIRTQIHYPVPPHLQPAFKFLGYRKGDFPVTEQICATELSLPVYPGLMMEQVDMISDLIRDFIAGRR
jgi:dTDP-4-amino-4,6-dideoxygalactose transaminase